MNLVQLCQRLIERAGISGLPNFTSAVAQTGGEGLRVVNWIADAWVEIQSKHEDWGFMRASYLNPTGPQGRSLAGVSFTTISGQAVYPLGVGAGKAGVAALTKWDKYSFRDYTTLSTLGDEIFLDPISYDDWRDGYMLGAMRNVRTRPVAVAIAPDMSVCLGPVPNSGYTIEADYWVTPQVLGGNDTESPFIPVQDHMIIVYEALKYYAAYESAPEVDDLAQTEFNKMYKRLESRFAPEVFMAAAIA